ncbi:hypothetical protein KCP74_07000 [Salmonella enterica subsp. enterica]|nr:hypothetical protein KCP74_07000 [Salmonella enterica subsp. enterica]
MSAALLYSEASGGHRFTGQTGGKILRRHPRYITLLAAPFYLLYLHFYVRNGACRLLNLLPALFLKSRRISQYIRPERRASISVIASQQAITASPISAAIAAIIQFNGAVGRLYFNHYDDLRTCR